MHSGWFLLGLLPSLAWGTAVQPTMRVHESRPSAPAGYMLVGPAEPERMMTLRFALTQRDPEGLIDALYDVSTPSGAGYGQYLGVEEVCTVVSFSECQVVC